MKWFRVILFCGRIANRKMLFICDREAFISCENCYRVSCKTHHTFPVLDNDTWKWKYKHFLFLFQQLTSLLLQNSVDMVFCHFRWLHVWIKVRKDDEYLIIIHIPIIIYQFTSSDSNTSGHFGYSSDQFMIHADIKDWWDLRDLSVNWNNFTN